MKFDKFCALILNEAKEKGKKFEKLVIGNKDPIFTAEDILRDPSDPSKGTKLYLATKEEKEKGLTPGDPQSIRRQLRRVNWIAKTLIKQYGKREAAFSIDAFNALLGMYNSSLSFLYATFSASCSLSYFSFFFIPCSSIFSALCISNGAVPSITISISFILVFLRKTSLVETLPNLTLVLFFILF